MFDFSNYSAKSKYFDDSNKLVVGKKKDETAGVAIERSVGLKPKMCLFLLDDNGEHKKAHGVNKNVIEIINHSEYIQRCFVESKMFEILDAYDSK